MNDRTTISTFQLFEMFPDESTARKYLESRSWPDGAKCPVCNHGERVATRKDGYYRCHQCQEDFTVRTGTIFERSHVPLHKWCVALGLIVWWPEIPSERLAIELGVTQKTAWLILRRVHSAAENLLASNLDMDHDLFRAVGRIRS